MFRKLILASAVSLALSPSGAAALGLGALRTDSALNQPFAAEINLIDVDPNELDAIKAALASEEEFAKVGAERYFYLTKLRFKPQIAPDGQPVLRVSSDDPIREPFLDFLVEVTWPEGRLVREYTVLLDPPVTREGRPRRTVAPPVAARSSVASPPQRGRAAPVREVSTQPQLPGDLDPSLFPLYSDPVPSGAGLLQIARQLAPPDATVPQTAMALFRSNQGAFIRGDINGLKVGETLVIPSATELFALDAQAADEELAAALRGQEVARAPLAEGATQQLAEEPTEARLRIAGAPSASEAVPTSPRPALDQRPDQPAAAAMESESLPAPVEEELLLIREANESTRQETDELRNRIRELEAQLADIQDLLALRNEQLAEMQLAQAIAAEERQVVATQPEVSATTAPEARPEEPATPLSEEPGPPSAETASEEVTDEADAPVTEPQSEPVAGTEEIAAVAPDAEPLAGPGEKTQEEKTQEEKTKEEKTQAADAEAEESIPTAEPVPPEAMATPEMPEPSTEQPASTADAEAPVEEHSSAERTPATPLEDSQGAGPETSEPSAQTTTAPVAEPPPEEPVAPHATAGNRSPSSASEATPEPTTTEGPTAEAEPAPPATQKVLPRSESGIIPWSWVAAGFGAVALLGGGVWYLARRRRRLAASLNVDATTPEADAVRAPGPDSRTTEGQTAAVASEPLTGLAESPSTPSSQSLRPFDEESEVDVFSEADIYIAYGRYREAEALLREEVNRDPERLDLQFKLAEAVFGMKKYEAFEALVDRLRAAGAEHTHPEHWRRLMAMQASMQEPPAEHGEPQGLAATSARSPSSAASPAPLQATSIDEAEEEPAPAPEANRAAEQSDSEPTPPETRAPAGSSDSAPVSASTDSSFFDMDLDLDTLTGSVSSQRAPEMDQVPDRFASRQAGITDPQTHIDSDLDLDLGDLHSLSDLDWETMAGTGEQRAQGQDSAEPRQADLDLNGPDSGAQDSGPMSLDLDLADFPVPGGQRAGTATRDQAPLSRAESPERGPFSDPLGSEDTADISDLSAAPWQHDSDMWDEVATKLDLARAYLDMKDTEAARTILDEVAEEGNDTQRAEAKQLLEQLD